MKTPELSFCNHTGLLYVNGVAFTEEMVERLSQLLIQNTEQFIYSVVIKDVNNQSETTVTAGDLVIIRNYISTLCNGIASDNDF